MSLEVAHHGHGHNEDLAHQFEDMEQQNDSYIVGMWTFLVTEIMFFGALFLCYVLYRGKFAETFYEISHHDLNKIMGGVNTAILLVSSYTMALAVYWAQQKHRIKQLLFLGCTIGCAIAFLVIKYFEWSEKAAHHHVPGPFFQYADAGKQYQAQMFFSLYFAMTGLHAIHVILGIVLLSVMGAMIYFRQRNMKYYMWLEMAGLYWHFVDIVWIFLFPLYYLIPKP